MSDTPQQRPQVSLRTEQERRWLEENREALDAYNEGVAKHGLLSEHAGVLTCLADVIREP